MKTRVTCQSSPSGSFCQGRPSALAMRKRTVLGGLFGLAVTLYIAVRRIGLAPHDVLLVCAVGVYAASGRGLDAVGY